MSEQDISAVTYSIEGYSTAAPLEMHYFTPYWGGYPDVESARRTARDLGNTRHRMRIVKVTREVVEYVTPPAEHRDQRADSTGGTP